MRLLRIAVLAVAFLIAVSGARAAAWQAGPPPDQERGGSQVLAYAATAVVLAAVVGGVWWTVFRSRAASPAKAAIPRSAVPDPPAQRLKNVFISYRRDDSADITGRISDRLVERYGKNSVFKDVDSIPIGRDFRTHLQQAVGRCDALLVIIGRGWSDASAHGKRRLDDARDHLRIEIESALERDILVIPVLVQAATMPEAEDLPESIRSLAYRNGVLVRPDPDFNGDLERLMRGIDAQFDNARS
jgi:hypothetical protein